MILVTLEVAAQEYDGQPKLTDEQIEELVDIIENWCVDIDIDQQVQDAVNTAKLSTNVEVRVFF